MNIWQSHNTHSNVTQDSNILQTEIMTHLHLCYDTCKVIKCELTKIELNR